jgi:hypothetical protein
VRENLQMNKSASIWMAVLTFTAIVMGVVLIATPSRNAQAAMLNVQQGFSLMTAGTVGGDEALIVIDKGAQKVIVYHLNGNTMDVMAGGSFGAAR